MSYKSLRSFTVLQVDERIRFALPVERRTTGAPEAHFLIKADRLTVLLIDVGLHFRMKCKAVAYQRGTDSSSSTCGIDGQRLHVALVDQHEG